MEKDVHTEHCCKSHGCKYSDPNCTVAHGDKTQSYPCEACDWDMSEDNELVKLMKWLSEQEYLTDYTQEKTNWEKIYQQYLEQK